MNINFADLIKNPAFYGFLGLLVTKIGAAATGQSTWKGIIMDVVLALSGLFLTNKAVNNTAALKRAGLMKP